jgi:uncharacterized protein (DUF4415 family)
MNDESPKFVRYVPGPLTTEQIERMNALAGLPDSEIDFSDIPELDEEFFRNAKRGTMHRLLKKQTTLRLDADILDWFKRHAKDGKGYQTDINKALRAYVVAQERRAAKKAETSGPD